MSEIEQQVRTMRCTVYGEVSDDAWESVRDKWMTPENVAWLKEHSQRPPFYPQGVHWETALADGLV